MQQQDNLTINLTVPASWEELDEKQLRYVFGLMANDKGQKPSFTDALILKFRFFFFGC